MLWRGRYLAGSFMVSYPCVDPLSGLFCPVLASLFDCLLLVFICDKSKHKLICIRVRTQEGGKYVF